MVKTFQRRRVKIDGRVVEQVLDFIYLGNNFGTEKRY
jgi:hypothetical protein